MNDIKGIKGVLRTLFDAAEYRRIENLVNTILRDRAIRKDFQRLKATIGSNRTIEHLAEKHFLSTEQVKFIVYKKKNSA